MKKGNAMGDELSPKTKLSRKERKEKIAREKRKQNRNRTQKPAGVLSIVFAVISLLILLDSIFLSWDVDGAAEWNVGAMGLFACMFAIASWSFGLVGRRDLTALQTLPKIGMFMGTILLLVTIFFWVFGAVMWLM